MIPLIFCDLETLGLTEDAEVFEAAFIDEDGTETLLWLPVDETKAEEGALRKNRYYLRKEECYRKHGVPDAKTGARKIAELTTGKRIAGNNVGPFDQSRLRNLLRRNGFTPAWDYRVFEVIDFAAGALGIKAPYESRDIAKALGLPERNDVEAHTAMPDARWAKLIYEQALAITLEREKRIQVSLVGLVPGVLHSFREKQSIVTDQFVADASTGLAKALNEKCWPAPRPAKVSA